MKHACNMFCVVVVHLVLDKFFSFFPIVVWVRDGSLSVVSADGQVLCLYVCACGRCAGGCECSVNSGHNDIPRNCHSTNCKVKNDSSLYIPYQFSV